MYPGDSPAGLAAGRKPWPALAAGLLWLAAGLTAGYWVLLALGRTPVTPVSAVASAVPVADPAAVAQALGFQAAVATTAAAPAPVAAPSRYALLGVVDGGPQRGAALLAVGGLPPRPYRVGAVVENGLVLQSVSRRTVRLGPALDGPATIELTVPELPEGPAATSAALTSLSPVAPRPVPAPVATPVMPSAASPVAPQAAPSNEP